MAIVFCVLCQGFICRHWIIVAVCRDRGQPPWRPLLLKLHMASVTWCRWWRHSFIFNPLSSCSRQQSFCQSVYSGLHTRMMISLMLLLMMMVMQELMMVVDLRQWACRLPQITLHQYQLLPLVIRRFEFNNYCSIMFCTFSLVLLYCDVFIGLFTLFHMQYSDRYLCCFGWMIKKHAPCKCNSSLHVEPYGDHWQITS